MGFQSQGPQGWGNKEATMAAGMLRNYQAALDQHRGRYDPPSSEWGPLQRIEGQYPGAADALLQMYVQAQQMAGDAAVKNAAGTGLQALLTLLSSVSPFMQIIDDKLNSPVSKSFSSQGKPPERRKDR